MAESELVKRKPSWWDTPQGRAVESRFRAWSEIQLHRGSIGFPSGNGTGRTGKPGDLPDVWQLAMDVDVTIGEWGNGKIESAILHVYGAGARPTTLEHTALDFWIERFFPEERGDHYRVFETVKGKIVALMLLEFGRFMAKQRGL